MNRSRMILKGAVVYPLILLLCEMTFLQPLLAQQADRFGLKIKIDEGAGGSTPVKLTSTEPPSVVVLDANNRPIPGAIVVFTPPDHGSSGVFDDGAHTMTVAADRNGRAVALGYRANSVAGAYQIQGHAQFINETADAAVPHTNVAAAKSSKKLFAILAIVGAGAAGAILAGSGGGGGGGGSTTPVSTIPTITFGGSTVGAPAP